jgi:peptidoglycan/LPS O-acetylase OafA/YrhL
MRLSLSLHYSINVHIVNRNASQTYWRADIQGLRALAVVAVIAFHLDTPVKSGFLGVDVFIVVSGYVITGLLLREVESSHRIRIFRFFKRRFLRLFPAHVVMLSVTFLLFLFIGPYGAHKAALNQARASVAFLANAYFFARSKDYFALGDDLTLFLNTWSLALEEQFYAIFALLISLLIFVAKRNGEISSKRIKDLMYWLFITLILLSITVAVISSMVWSSENKVFEISTINPGEWIDFLVTRGADFAFYSPVTRAWQFLIGALLAIMSFDKAKLNNWISSDLAIVALILVLTFASAQATVFFSWSRISATLLTAIIIVKGSSWLSKRWLVLIGDRSYSLFLWHYPLIVISKSIYSGWALVALLLLIVFFAEISYRFVETPFRQSNTKNLKKLNTSKTVPTALVLLSVCVLILRLDVSAKNLIDRSYFVTESSIASHFYDDATSCWSDGFDLTCGVDLKGSILLIGDSHAESLRPGFFKAINSINFKPRFRDGRCLFASFDRNVEAAEASGCDASGIRLQEEIVSQQPRIIVFLICGRIHDSCPEGLESESEGDWVSAGMKALQPILDAGVSIALVRDLPVLNPDPRYSASVARSVLNLPISSYEIDKGYQQISRSRFERLFSELTPSNGKLFEVQFLSSICSAVSCNAKTRAGLDIWRDEDHLSINGSIEIVDVVAREISRIIKD